MEQEGHDLKYSCISLFLIIISNSIKSFIKIEFKTNLLNKRLPGSLITAYSRKLISKYN